MSLRKTSNMSEVDLEAKNIDGWEAAYLRFETPEQEIRKFLRRLKSLGVADWPRDLRVLELFCGRGNGLRALELLGFQQLEGIDLSPNLVAEYRGSAKCYVGDCRHLPFDDRSRDVAIIHGGLHHLPVFPADLERTLAEIRRVLRPQGRVVIVEPFTTPFLSVVHFACRIRIARALSGRLDALSTMIGHERQTYEQWLADPK